MTGFAKTLICVTIALSINSGGKCGFNRLCRAFDELLSSKEGEKNVKKITLSKLHNIIWLYNRYLLRQIFRRGRLRNNPLSNLQC